jgi:CRP-like cAMP-binding protein
MIGDFFRQFNLFSEEEVDQLTRLFERKTINKNELFLKEGEKCKEIAFIESGIFRTYYISEDGKDVTYCFRFPNDLLASYSSFISNEPSVENIQAISDASVLIIRKKDLEEFGNDNLNWIKFLKIIAEQEYIGLENRFFELQRDNASKRYATLTEKHPNYIQEIPLFHLASYLGITQRHLSRIRNNVSF